MINTDHALDYIDFVTARHAVWQARQRGDAQPWTDHDIVARCKFTNVFRILDPGTQVLMREGFLAGELADVLMRCFLYRHTGRAEVWDWLVTEMLGQPTVDDIEDVYDALMEYRGASKDITCGNSVRGGPSRPGRKFERSVFTGAYLVFPQSQVPGTDKLRAITDLTLRLFTPGSPDYVVDTFLASIASGNPAGAFEVLRKQRGVADFMSMQILTDYGYGPGELDDTFVVAGPGATNGAGQLGLRAPAAIAWAHQTLANLDIRIPLPDGRLHAPSAMDAQNTLCEYFKLSRYLDGTSKPAQKAYKPAHPGTQLAPVLPAHW